MGFQTSGYMADIPKYAKPEFGGIIDSHILLRLKIMQKKGVLNNITFSYYNQSDLIHYKNLVKLCEFTKIKYLPVTELIFKI